MKKIYLLVFFIALAAVAIGPLSSSAAPQAASPSLTEISRQATFIFAGTVQKVNATTMSTVPASESTAVVRVNEILRNAGVVSDIQGKDITVQLSRAGTVKAGERDVFFTNVAVYGSSLVVREIHHVNSESTAARGQLSEALQQLPDEDLKARLVQADLVLTGRVRSTRPVVASGQHPRTSEHDPEWWQALVEVQSVEKGQSNDRVVVVYFPRSDDIRWFASPKLKEGQQGIFLLRQTQDEQLKINGFTALHPLDFQPVSQQQRIRTLTQKLH